MTDKENHINPKAEDLLQLVDRFLISPDPIMPTSAPPSPNTHFRYKSGAKLHLQLRDEPRRLLLEKGVAPKVLDDYRDALTSAWNPFLDQAAKDELAQLVAFNRARVLIELGLNELSHGHFNQAHDLFLWAFKCSQQVAPSIHNYFEALLLKYYALSQEEENPSNGHHLPRRVITEAELRTYIKEQAALLTERAKQLDDAPFPILDQRTVKAIIAHGKKHQWDERRVQGWPYHTNAFVFVHITYRKWANRGLTREILARADPSLHAHLNRKISIEGLPQWLDLPTGPEARARAITDPVERAELDIVRKHQRRKWHEHVRRRGLGD
jgi:hypothetical protein